MATTKLFKFSSRLALLQSRVVTVVPAPAVRQFSRLAILRQQQQQNQQPQLIVNKSSIFRTVLKAYSTETPNESQIQERVLDIVAQFDRVKENAAMPEVKVKLESHLIKDLGLDSLDHVEIIVQLEDSFGYEIPDSDYEKLLTPSAIVAYLQKRVAEI